MNWHRIAILAAFATAAILWVSACGDGAVEPATADPPRPTTVAVTPATAELTALGATVRLSAEVRDQNGQVIAGATVGWTSSDASVATVDGSGQVTAAANGAATITATTGSVSGTAAVTVAQVVNSVAVSPTTDTLVAFGDTVRLMAEAADANGHPVAAVTEFEWASSDTLVVTVDDSGLVETIAEGEAVVTATASGVTGQAELSVVPPLPTTIAVSPDTVRFTALGQVVQLTAEVREQAGRVMAEAFVTWSSGDTTVAAVDSAGLVTAEGGGTATITARAGDASGDVVVSVMQSAGSVVVLPSEATIALGDTLRLAAEAFDENGHSVKGTVFTWSSSDAAVATVDESGLVQAIGEGAARVTAMADNASGTAEITVDNPDRAALLALYEATDGPNWTNNENWLTDAPLGEWHGVVTDGTGRVEELQLSGNALTGTIPGELGALSNLKGLYLWVNSLTGPIPPELGNLANLETLSLVRNRLTGSIPPELGNLTSLNALLLDRNLLTGTIPPDLGNLANLTAFRLTRNRLTGTIPRGFVRSSLLDLRFQDNDGLCAPGTANFKAWINTLDRFEGPFCNASDIATLKHLYTATGGSGWENSHDWLTEAPLEDWYGVGVDTLGLVRTLDLSRNRLSGDLPSQVADLTRITELRISGNALSGRLPLSLAKLSLNVFHYTGTELCVPSEAVFGQWIAEISSHEGTGVKCAPLSDRDRLIALYNASGGPNWNTSTGWLSESPLESWHGVEVDSDGSVTRLVLPDNALTGRIPLEIVGFRRITDLVLSGNALTGTIPPAIGNFTRLLRLNLAANDLTGMVPPELGRLANLEVLNLASNELRGPIPSHLRGLTNLRRLDLGWNKLTGLIPRGIGELADLHALSLSGNNLSGPIPAELGELGNLQSLYLRANGLTGPIPSEIANLGSLSGLSLAFNDLTGPIPPELGDLVGLAWLDFSGNILTGSIPSELGNLANLQSLSLAANELTGRIPSELGNLVRLELLDLSNNGLTGPVPPEFGSLTRLVDLTLAGNSDLSGALPGTLTNLRHLETIQVGGTELCATSSPGFLEWLARIPNAWVALCAGDAAAAYLVQSVQSRRFPVPLVAGKEALLRVFITATRANEADLPPVRASLYLQGRLAHVADIPGKRGPVPTEIDESSLAVSSNALIPPEVIQPGLEMVLEIDPEGMLDSGLGVARRVPENGRLTVDVRATPVFDLTVVPVLRAASPDSSILSIARQLTADNDLLRDARTLLPIGGMKLTVHEPVTTTTSGSRLLSQIEAIRVMEGTQGHYLGLYSQDVSPGGIAYLGGRSSLAVNRPGTIAHELGHNLGLPHAPCSAPGVDPLYPHRNGIIGAWGYDTRNGDLMPPSLHDLMSYCYPQWISDYNFTKSLRFRLADEAASEVTSLMSDKALLLWGGVSADGQPYLDPAFVVDAPARLPSSVGDHVLTGRTADGVELFSLAFDMLPVSDGEGEEASFVFALPLQAGWADLASITLSGPGGSATLDDTTNRPMAILRDLRTGQVRAFLRDPPPAGQTAADAVGGAAGPGLETLFSRGIPGAEAWRR